jgi:prevent-host-death family protein
MENNEINSVTAQQMREQLSDLLNRAAYLHEPTRVTRQGKTVAVLVSVRDWEQYLELTAAIREKETGDKGQAGEARQFGSKNVTE